MSDNLWQSPAWEQYQQALGHKVVRLQKAKTSLLLILLPIAKGYHYGYIPRGPQTASERDLLLEHLPQLKKDHNLIFVKVDPFKAFSFPGYKARTSSSVQPRATRVLDLNLSQEALLKQMKRKGRYNIQLAQKKGVVVTRAATAAEQQEALADFYDMLQETTSRDGFSSHAFETYRTMLQKLKGTEIFTASHEGIPIAAALVVQQGKTAIYYYGASSNAKRSLMAPYLVQWEVLCWAKEQGCTVYDFLGVRHPDEENSPLEGVTAFKEKFGGEQQLFPAPKDLILNMPLYTVFRCLKQVQKMLR